MQRTTSISIEKTLSEVEETLVVDIILKRVESLFSFVENINEISPGQLSKKFRVSYDSSEEFGPWETYTSSSELESIEVVDGDDIHIQLMYVLVNGEFEIDSFNVEYEGEKVDLICPVRSFADCLCAEEELEDFVDWSCTPFNPYETAYSKHIYNNLNKLVNKVYGHNVKYFKVKEDPKSADTIFKEYHLYNVVSSAEFKITIPNNEIPINEDLQFSEYDIGFRDMMEIHIPIDEYCEAFGINKQYAEHDRPQERDYLFLPVINKMFEIHSVTPNDKRPSESTYWKVFLVLKSDRSDTKHASDITQEEEDAITFSMDEHFEKEVEEGTKTAAPKQTYSDHPDLDPVRELVNSSLHIAEEDIINNFTIIALNNYDLSSINEEDKAVVYRKMINITNSFHFSSWLKWLDEGILFTSKDSNLIIEIVETGVNFTLNGDNYEFSIPNWENVKGEWLSIVFESSNKGNWGRFKVYMIDESEKTTELKTFFNESFNLTSSIEFKDKIDLRGMDAQITNIRFLTKTINEEDHSNFLNKSVIEEDNNVIIVDQAMPLRETDYFKRTF